MQTGCRDCVDVLFSRQLQAGRRVLLHGHIVERRALRGAEAKVCAGGGYAGHVGQVVGADQGARERRICRDPRAAIVKLNQVVRVVMIERASLQRVPVVVQRGVTALGTKIQVCELVESCRCVGRRCRRGAR